MRPIAPAALLLSACLALVAADEATTPAPVAITDPGVFALIVVPDLMATLGRIEAAAELIAPGKVPAGSLKNQLGARLKDPALGNLGSEPILIVVGPGVPVAIAAVFPTKNPQLLVDFATQAQLMAKAVDDLVVIAKLPDGLALGEKVAGEYDKLTSTPIKADLRILTAPERAIAAYGAMLTGLGQMAATQAAKRPGQEMLAKIVPLEIAGLLAVFGDLGATQFDLSLGDGMVKADVLIAAKPDSALAKALVASPMPAVAAASRMDGETGVMAVAGRVNIAGFADYGVGLLATLAAKPEGKELITDELIAAFKSWSGLLTGDFAARFRSTTEVPMLIDGVYGCADNAKAAELLSTITALMTGDGSLAKVYRNLGITMEVTKDARAVGGVPVQRWKYILDETKMNELQSMQMHSFLHDYEVALPKDWLVLSQDPKSLDGIVAGSGSGLKLRAERTIGPGRDGYVDFDLIGYLRLIGHVLGGAIPPDVAKTFGELPASDPFAVAWTTAAGRSHIEYRVPLKPFADIAAAFRKLSAAPVQPKTGAAAKEF